VLDAIIKSESTNNSAQKVITQSTILHALTLILVQSEYVITIVLLLHIIHEIFATGEADVAVPAGCVHATVLNISFILQSLINSTTSHADKS